MLAWSTRAYAHIVVPPTRTTSTRPRRPWRSDDAVISGARAGVASFFHLLKFMTFATRLSCPPTRLCAKLEIRCHRPWRDEQDAPPRLVSGTGHVQVTTYSQVKWTISRSRSNKHDHFQIKVSCANADRHGHTTHGGPSLTACYIDLLKSLQLMAIPQSVMD